jgi:putative CocE/NonD family hydrolase
MSLTKEHEKNIWPKEVANSINYIDDKVDYYGDVQMLSNSSVDLMIKNLRETQIPVLILGGFFDGFSKGSIQSFASLKDTNPVYLFMDPRFHLGLTYEYWKWMEVKHNTSHQRLSTQLQFFDRYLKGKENGLETSPPVKIYTAFDGWKFYDSWPPKEASPLTYNLGQNNLLTEAQQEDTVYSYDVDFTHSSSYGPKRFNPQLMYMYTDSLMTRNEQDKKCLVFETEVLNDSVTITGSPIVNLYVSSDQVNSDVYVYLSDVDTLGVVYYVAEGKMRAGWHKLYDNDQMVNGLYDVKPELPWHSYKEEDYDETPFANDSIINLKFDMQPQAWKFRPGHKIRLSIAGADYTNYEFNPAISVDNTLENCKPTTLDIHTGKKYNSYIELPIIK